MKLEQRKIFESFALEAVLKLLPGVRLLRTEGIEESKLYNWAEPVYLSVVGFESSHMNGLAMLSCNHDFMLAHFPGYDTKDIDLGHLYQDWLGELSNLIIGRLKNKLQLHGVTLTLHPPSAVEAQENIFDSYQLRSNRLKLLLGLERQLVCLCFNFDIGQAFNLADGPSESTSSLQPGDAIYRLNEQAGKKKKYDAIAHIRSGHASDDGEGGQDELEAELSEEDFSNSIRPWLTNLDESAGVEERAVDVEEQTKNADSAKRAKVQLSSFQTRDPAHRANSRPKFLLGVDWMEDGELHLNFQGGTSYRLQPKLLLNLGYQQISLAGLTIEWQKTANGMLVRIAELELCIELAARVA